MAENKNLAIWNAVKTTDARFTKDGNQDGRKVTSINHIGMLEKATELWGPIGIGWGYDIVEERDDQGKPNWNGEVMVGHDITHTLRLRLWYELDGKRGSVENYGHTPRIYWSHQKKYFVEDKEAAKKSLTDAFKKCMSFLGFSADIYGGQWDDPEYRRERVTEAVDEKAKERAEHAREKYLKERRLAFDTATNGPALKAHLKSAIDKQAEEGNAGRITVDEFNLRKAALTKLATEIAHSKGFEKQQGNDQ